MGEPYTPRSIIRLEGHDPNWNILVRSEKKSTEIPKVVTSEIGTAQTLTVPRMSPLPAGGHTTYLLEAQNRDTYARMQENSLERLAIEGNSPVSETYLALVRYARK